jgi:N-acetylneuraminate epimerase
MFSFKTLTNHQLFASCISGFAVLIIIVAAVSTSIANDSTVWNQLPSLPDSEGFAGPFAGTHGSALIVGGGANFPDKMPWEGGKKVWYDRVFVLESPDGNWHEAGKLPRPLGYGVSISNSDGLICIGGSDSVKHYADCFRLQWRDGRLVKTVLPSLPKPCANFCGAMLGNKIYVAGGLESPDAATPMRTFWSLDLADPHSPWEELEPWPGPARMLATAAVQDMSFFLCSGTDLKPGADGKNVREYLRDAYRFQPGRGWKKIAGLPRPVVAAPTPAISVGQSSFWILGGDDGALVDFYPPEKHPGFPTKVLAYHTIADTWQFVGDAPAGHVTTAMVEWYDRFVIPSGEVRPGKRSPAVWSMPKPK